MDLAGDQNARVVERGDVRFDGTERHAQQEGMGRDHRVQDLRSVQQ